MKSPFWRRLGFWALLSMLTSALLLTQPYWLAYTHVSPFALRGLPERMKQVKKGVTEDQMWQTLAIPHNCCLGEVGGGSENDIEVVEKLPYGYRLYYGLDRRYKPALFLHGEVTCPHLHWQ